jgi:hypothetical protein
MSTAYTQWWIASVELEVFNASHVHAISDVSVVQYHISKLPVMYKKQRIREQRGTTLFTDILRTDPDTT